MNKNYLESIYEIILDEEITKKFEIKKSADTIIINSESSRFEIIYDDEKKLVYMNLIDEENKSKRLSSWSFDKEQSNIKDTKLIAKDFLEILNPKKQKSSNNQISVKKNENESNITGLFFVNRMATFFPDLKDAINEEKISQGEFRLVTFTRSYILPEILKMLENTKEKTKINKFFKTLGELYKNGNLDVRSTITMVILNNIENKKAKELASESMSEEFQKSWKAALKFKDKKIKPEKIKTRKSFMTKILEASNKK